MKKQFEVILLTLMVFVCLWGLVLCSSCSLPDRIPSHIEQVNYVEFDDLEYSPETKCISHKLFLIDQRPDENEPHVYLTGGC